MKRRRLKVTNLQIAQKKKSVGEKGGVRGGRRKGAVEDEEKEKARKQPSEQISDSPLPPLSPPFPLLDLPVYNFFQCPNFKI